ncbi:hypothetical protein [Microvirga sp. VF16]|uniref:hypothetical protein n=1 Tax=Microvirga sp. VF16 TaxID=2807101 RepID=UPI00193CA503|nr:hypothetical protein [Microvirga sp. VF16]QRM35097.1 hypothetical protein JO965_39550 [Microvirga sp. VF16]
MFTGANSPAVLLPVEIRRTAGAPSATVNELERRLSGYIEVPVDAEVESLDLEMDIGCVWDPDEVGSIIDAYATLENSEELKERTIDILEHARRDLRSHALVRAQSAGKILGFVVIKRGIEYISSRSGTPDCIRMVHDVLAAAESEGGVLQEIIGACGILILSDVFNLHQGAGAIGNDLLESMGELEEIEPGLKMLSTESVRVECHVRGSAGSQDEVVRAFSGIIESYSGHLGDFEDADGTAGPAYVVGPFVPGNWFEDDGIERGQDSHEDLRRREILRSASLIAYSDIRRLKSEDNFMPLPGLRIPELVAEHASPDILDVASLALDPEIPHPATVFGNGAADVRRAQVRISHVGNRAFSLCAGLRRTLSLALDAGYMAPLLLDIQVCHVLGVRHTSLNERLGEVIMSQVVSDLQSLASSLTSFDGQIQIRIRVPNFVLRSVRKVVTGDWEAARVAVSAFETNHTVLEPVIEAADLWPDQGEPYSPTMLFQPMPVEIDVQSIDLYDFMEGYCSDVLDGGEVAIEKLEVLRYKKEGPQWLDLDDIESFRCVEPFLFLRGWVNGVPIPAVVSSLTLRGEEIENLSIADLIKDFVYTLASSEDGWTSVAPIPQAISDLTAAAHRLFKRSEIHVAPLNLVALRSQDSFMIFGDERSDEDKEIIVRCAHLDEYGALGADQIFLGPKSTEFIVAVHNDLRVGTVYGVERVLALFLTRRANELLEVAGPEASCSILYLSRLYVRAGLAPEGTDLTALALSEDLIRDLEKGLEYKIDRGLLGRLIKAAEGNFVRCREGAPIYMIVATIADAYERFLHELSIEPIPNAA